MEEHKKHRLKVIIALVSLYIFWGGTYLGMKIGIESIPPFLLAGIRFLSAGSILYIIARLTGSSRGTLEEWKNTGIIGAMLLLGGNGLVCWAEQTVSSGIASLMVATVPVWIIILGMFGKDGKKPSLGIISGIIMGLAGISLLVFQPGSSDNKGMNLIGITALLFATLFWSAGSLFSKKAKLPKSPLMSTAMQMLAGGVLLMIFSLIMGEWARFDISGITLRSYLGLGYLIIFGSIIGYNAYIWLLKHAEPSWVSTYAFVNPIVAVFLGWAFAGEQLTSMSVLSAFIIITAVTIITIFKK